MNHSARVVIFLRLPRDIPTRTHHKGTLKEILLSCANGQLSVNEYVKAILRQNEEFGGHGEMQFAPFLSSMHLKKVCVVLFIVKKHPRCAKSWKEAATT